MEWDIFLEAERHETPADFVSQIRRGGIRARVERSTPERDPAAGGAAYRKVRDEAASSKLLTTRHVELPQTSKRQARLAYLEVQAKEVRVKPPHAKFAVFGDVQCRAGRGSQRPPLRRIWRPGG